MRFGVHWSTLKQWQKLLPTFENCGSKISRWLQTQLSLVSANLSLNSFCELKCPLLCLISRSSKWRPRGTIWRRLTANEDPIGQHKKLVAKALSHYFETLLPKPFLSRLQPSLSWSSYCLSRNLQNMFRNDWCNVYINECQNCQLKV